MNKPQMSLENAHRVRRNFRLLALATSLTLAIGAIVMHVIEKLSWVDSIYFAVVSLTTVGYGDITPKTAAGKLFVCAYLLVGIGIIAAFASNLIKNAVARKVINQSVSE